MIKKIIGISLLFSVFSVLFYGTYTTNGSIEETFIIFGIALLLSIIMIVAVFLISTK